MKKETLYRYFGNCATEEERNEVVTWAQASPENLKEFCRERNIYNAVLLSTDAIQHTQYDFRRHYRIQLLRIAAVVILLLSVAFGAFYFTLSDRIVPLYSLTVPAGNSNTLLLPDGTKVWLNAESTIKYPSSFMGLQRNIEIEGEAYLEVAHNRWRPFIVNTPQRKDKGAGYQILRHFNHRRERLHGIAHRRLGKNLVGRQERDPQTGLPRSIQRRRIQAIGHPLARVGTVERRYLLFQKPIVRRAHGWF